jgi:3-dehydroquinate dehydratase/shikimate dehydrogenase
MAELLSARDAVRLADMVELRLDGVADVDVAGALAGRRRPAIVTCRASWEGGRFDGSEEERYAILARALNAGAEFVDVEWRALRGGDTPAFAGLIDRGPGRIVLSSHDFEGVPEDLDARARDMRSAGTGAIKLAVAARRLSDTLPLRRIARDGNAIVIGMGDAGVPSRLLAARYGSRWTYAGDGVAPGQVPAERMVDEFRFRTITQQTRLFGVVSGVAMHSLSPVMHNAAFAAAGLDAVYVPLQASDFDDFLDFAAALGIEGASITIPFKRDALQAAALADDLTAQVGAANTLRRVRAVQPPAVDRQAGDPTDAAREETHSPGALGDEWEATNTDVPGFLAPIERTVGTLTGRRAAVLGAGGSARAVVVALLSRGARVTVHARRREQVDEVTAALGAEAGSWPVPAGSWDLLVNCTPLGGPSARDVSPLPGGPFTGALVYDLTYGPGESPLIREARESGCATLDGLPMLVAQAERQFEWWTGQIPPPGVMASALDARLDSAGARPRRTAQTRNAEA